MPDTLQSVLIGGAAGIVSSVITHFSTRAKVRLDLAAAYDKELQHDRLTAYKELWAMLERISRYGQTEKVTNAVLRDISNNTRAWYFKTGGIYLTERSRKPYFDWKAAMQPVLDNGVGADPSSPIRTEDDDAMAEVVRLGSALRTALSDDIGTKRLSRV